MFRTIPKDFVYFREILEEGSDDDSLTGAAGIDKLEDEEVSHPKIRKSYKRKHCRAWQWVWCGT